MGKTIMLSGFASVVTVEEVKEFLEGYTGEGTVEAVKVGKPKTEGGSRAHAKVQFKTMEDVERILLWTANQDLWHNDSYLKAWTWKRDIIPQAKPQFNLHSIDNLKLHFGYQVSKEKFSVLWKQDHVSFRFGEKLDKLYFFLSYNSVEYKLQLFNENVWQIVLHYPSEQTNKKCLIIQLLGAPRIDVKDVLALSSYNEGTEDDLWVREVDFTPGHCIGQSFALCLEVPPAVQLPRLDENFDYKQDQDNFALQNGSTFSTNPDFVPMISPPPGFDLPYGILFKVNSLVQHGCLPPTTLDASFFELVDPCRISIALIEHALEKLFRFRECGYEPVKWLNEQYKEYRKLKKPPRPPVLAFDDGLVAVRRIQVTPSKVYFCGPDLNLSNRVLRNYIKDIDNFIRISFVDEELGKIHSTDLSSSTVSAGRLTGIYHRILSTLRNGIVIGDKKFEFLACSASQLRENTVWMFASKPGLTAVDIREKMGHFRAIRNVAKYSARLGQSLSSSRETLEVSRNETEIIPDIEVKTGGTKYVFSDGIGKISAELAKEVARKCGVKVYTPSAFQIRYGGYKGVVAVDPSSLVKLSLRKSMEKYDADSSSLDVLSWSKYHPCFLNRQIIILMSTLGVQDSVFEKKQKEALAQLDAILTDPEGAREAMEWISHGEIANVIREMLLCGYNPDSEPFLSMILQAIRASKLLDLRTKTRIFVKNGRTMMGCLDETGTLQYGQVFVQYSKPKKFLNNSLLTFSNGRSDKKCHVVEGKVVVAKNPCLHPGDLRVLQAVDAAVLHHMVDCIVFPQKGHRPHPNECSGSDLDGDMYFISWDEDLIPPCQFPPMVYDAAPALALDHDVTMEDVTEYFTNYMVNDNLGIICNAHTIFADKEPLKAMSEACIELAKLASIAVDFPKTGIPAKIPYRLRALEYPDFMEKPDKISYESQSLIGRLYREVQSISTGPSTGVKHFTKEVAEQFYDFDMEVDGFLAYVEDAKYWKTQYDFKLANLMRAYRVKTEAEMITGCISKVSRFFDRRRDLETIGLAVRSLRKEARGWFKEEGNVELNSNAENVLAKASAWYHVTYHPSFWGVYNDGVVEREHFISFPWCIYHKLLLIKGKNRGKSSHFSSPERQSNPIEIISDEKTSRWGLCSFM